MNILIQNRNFSHFLHKITFFTILTKSQYFWQLWPKIDNVESFVSKLTDHRECQHFLLRIGILTILARYSTFWTVLIQNQLFWKVGLKLDFFDNFHPKSAFSTFGLKFSNVLPKVEMAGNFNLKSRSLTQNRYICDYFCHFVDLHCI